MATPSDAPALAALFVADNLAAVQSELVAVFPSTVGDPHSLNQGTDADKPAMQVTGIGGHKGLQFDGVSDRLFDDVTTLLNNVAGATFYTVFQIGAIPGATVQIFGITTDQTGTLLVQTQMAVINTGEFRTGGRRISADAFVGLTAAGKNVCDGLPHIGCTVADYAAGTMQVYVDGSALGSVALASAGNTSAAGRARLAMATSPGAFSNFWPGLIGMGGIYHVAHDAAARSKVHTWAQDTYGMKVADYAGSGLSTPVLSGSLATDTEASLSWPAVSGAKTYEVERNGAVIATGVTGTTYADAALSPGTTYKYRVRAKG